MRQPSVRKVQSAMVKAGEPPLVSGAGMDTIHGLRLYGRCAVPASLRLRGRHKTPRPGRRAGGHAPLPDHFTST
jgi:hypothetical protein